ncbi:uncharacterized protein LOC131893068 [Tigriopus californicus]|uniref:uncharacterized protein LOC131893068 n=1 Tax=Tigriopus californicus TaxID=6832 RepID=UPI0027DA19ED|nr:uncharacterized protein LOC131893068 [Tigriopus californicus]
MMSHRHLKLRLLELLKIKAYFIIVLLLFYQIYLCFESYLAYPKYVSTKIVDQRNTVFPEVTFCPNDTTLRPGQFMRSYYERYNKARSDGISFQGYENATLLQVLKKTKTPGWQGCMTLSRNDEHQQLGLYYIRLNYRNVMVKLYVHFPGRLEENQSLQMPNEVTPGQIRQFQVMYQDTHLQPIHFFNGSKSCWEIGDENQKGTPCRSLEIILGKSNDEMRASLWPNKSEQYLYFMPYVLKHEEKFAYSFLRFASDVGGYSGILTGMSLLHGLAGFRTLVQKSVD